MLNHIKIVLVRTFHPGNIGSAARAMKTMGLHNLWLVQPRNFPADDALKMARSADDIVLGATRVESVYAAVKDCQLVVASTARQRGYDLPVLNPEQCARQLINHAGVSTGQVGTKQKVALLFGPERMGLNNDDLRYAHYRVTIPTSPDYSSLNMAAAVQTLSYEIFKQFLQQEQQQPARVEVEERPSIEDMERFYEHLEQALLEAGFIFRKHPGEVMLRFRQLFTKAQLTRSEVSMLRGALSAFQQRKKRSAS